MLDTRRFGALVLMALVCLPVADALAQKGKKKENLSGKVDSSKLAASKYSGVLKSGPDKDRVFDLEISVAGGKKVLVEFQLSEKAKVRTTILSDPFDDKGNPRKYTRKELDAMKGKDKTLPGYESSTGELRAGQTVQLTLASAPRPAGGKKKDDPDILRAAEKSKQVRLVVILKSPD